MQKLIVLASLLLSAFTFSAAQEVGFEEEFALAPDRSAVLEQLIPGTPDYYYYGCLQHQHLGELERVPALMKLWRERHGRTARYHEIEYRQALLSYNSDPSGTLKFLRKSLDLRYDHKRVIAGEKSPLPSLLAPELMTLEAWTKRALQGPNNLSGFGPSMLETTASMDLTERQLQYLMEHLQRPDVPGLPALVVRDLARKSSGGFGSLAIHKALLLEQLEDCLILNPELLNDSRFTSIYLMRLAPGADVNWRDDATEREAYLDRLWAFARRLTASSNGLKAHVLQHRLMHDISTGQPNRERLLEYLRLPRRVHYANQEYLNSRGQNEIFEKRRNQATLLGNAGDEENLVRTYLEHFFQTDDSWAAFSEYVREDYLKRVFAETKILAGVGDMERWYSLINDSSYYEQLEQRVEIEFAPTAQLNFAANDSVSLEVHTKNVETLLVKVFEIDALAYARAEGHDVDASIDLDGLVPGAETTYTYTEPALRRVRRQFDFPELTRPGVYVIDFIGGGLSSRAVIHKGQLQLRERVGSAGHVFQVLNAAGEAQAGAAIYFAGRRYEADDTHEILLPFSTSPGQQTLILQSGRLVAVESFQHLAESYSLHAGIHVDQEAMMAGGSAKVLVRASLRINGALANIDLLTDPILTLVATDVHGTQTSLDVRDLELHGDREFVHEFQIPDNIVQLRAGLRGQVENLSTGETDALSSTWHDFQQNRVDATGQVDCPILGRDDQGFFVDVLGKNSEPRANRVLGFAFRHGGFQKELRAQLKTDATGRVRLGELPGVVSVLVDGFPSGTGAWQLSNARRTQATELHGREGQVLRVPYDGQAQRLTRRQVSLLELRGGQFMTDRFAHASLKQGFIELRDLPAGDYDLLLKESGASVRVRVTRGALHGIWAVGTDRSLELGRPQLQLLTSEWNGGDLELQLANAGSNTRVHVFSTRFEAGHDAFEGLLSPTARRLSSRDVERIPSSYDSGRQIGDEYRYILERRFAQKYAGNMLPRPGLLLNPWAIRDSSTGIGVGGGFGGRFGGRKKMRSAGGAAPSSRARRPQGQNPGTFPNLNFLPVASVTLANLRPDESGRLVIAADQLGAGQQIRIVVVDGETTIEERLQRAEQPRESRERRLTRGLDPATHSSEQRRIEFLAAGESATIQDGASTEAVTYDTLGDVFQLFRTLNPDAELESFVFLMDWPNLSAEEKHAAYSRSASHELHMFLYHKDREFFESVLRPYLVNKADKTFIDLWLLEEDLTVFVEPWAFAQLNVFERVLLGQRIDSLRESVARHIQDQVDFAPPGVAELEALYGATLATGAMEDKLAKLGYTYRGPGDTVPPGESRGREMADGPSGPSAPGPDRIGAERVKVKLSDDEVELEVAEEPSLSDFALDLDSKDAGRRDQSRHFYRGLGATEQYAEHNYWHQLIHNQNASLIEANSFWLDFAQADPGQPFHSEHFGQAAGNVAEMMMALAVLDLPFAAEEHSTSREGNQVTLVAGGPMILVRKEMASAQLAETASSLLVGQQFFALNDRYRFEGNERRERLIEDEFLVGTPYGCRVVVTNPSPDPVQLEILWQIPNGSMPINAGFVTRGVPVQLAPYATHQVEFGFYFPAAGEWSHYPAHATRDSEWLAAADALTMNVVLEPTKQDTTSWEHISQRATQAELMTFLEGSNLLRLDLARIAWRMAERSSFDQVTGLLRSRQTYHPVLWSYSMQHGDVPTIREFLRHATGLNATCGPWLESPLLDIEPIERRTYQRLEFRPLVNARAHPEGEQRKILNQELAAQYSRLLNILGHKPQLDDADWISVTYYLLLQDRIEEALESFARVTPAALPTQVQYDYMRAYLDFFSDDLALARGIAERYSEHPVPHWRERFAQIVAHLDEAEGRVAVAGDDAQGTSGNDNLAAAEPSLEVEVASNRVTLRHRNLEQVEVRYYIMDVEFLFSTSPFVQQSAGSFNYVKPNRSDILTMPADGTAFEFDLPAEFQSSNVLVEARAGGLVERHAHYANTMQVQWIENYGQLKVSHAQTGKPLSRVYVKVFVRTGNGVRFHKDGYTDLRGRFDYVSISGDDGEVPERFAVLVLDEENGAVIRELSPPKQ